MTPIVPRIAIFSIAPIHKIISCEKEYSWFASSLECHYFTGDVSPVVLHDNRFNLLVFVEHSLPFRRAYKSKLPKVTLRSIDMLNGSFLYELYTKAVLTDYNPTVSIFTPTYNTFEKFNRAYQSVINQSFDNWEWIILDDSPDNKNYDYINNIVKNDHRIKLYKSNKRDSFVGSTKRQAASLCNGKYLLELDHDDELHHLALEYVVKAFITYPDAGFCYSNSCETYEEGGNVRYGDNFAMGFGVHHPFHYKGRDLLGADVPINASTIRHIVGVPNHFRCWERDTYFRIARHNNKLAVVDDYELLIRTFLHTKMVHVPEVLYIQYMNSGGNNTQEPRRAEIQRLVDRVQKHYDEQIHQRIIELGGDDWLWNEASQSAEIYRIPPRERKTLAYVLKV